MTDDKLKELLNEAADSAPDVDLVPGVLRGVRRRPLGMSLLAVTLAAPVIGLVFAYTMVKPPTVQAVPAATPTESIAPTPTKEPMVKVYKGAKVRVTTNPPGICTDKSCAYIRVTTANFATDPTCRLYWPHYNKTWKQGADEDRSTGSYFGNPNAVVTVICDGVSGSVIW